MQDKYAAAFDEARRRHQLPDTISIAVHGYALSQLPAAVKFDTIVSPANSYGVMDGAFDDAISRALSPVDDYGALTRAVQAQLYRQWRGFAPPGTCTLVQVPWDDDKFAARNTRSRNVWGAKRVALCPTMRLPSDAEWNREVVYECVWGLLCAVDNHNRAVRQGKAAGNGGDQDEIRSVLMTPLATGVGRVSPERWAAQAVLAMKHFEDASRNPETWSRLGWKELGDYSLEVEATWKQEKK
ncbi:appr-1-p processing enzyme family [Apiospora aurea]|uniref:Appr-1-p processing enzyme family n=1 Tax=Apiospora aurea TaxID=335848 RepID=A0ABR1Q580_9PEZI